MYHTLYGTQYVLLAGTEIPIRYGYRDTSQVNTNINELVPNDWYFSDLTTNWNTNGNTYYGEYHQYNVERFDCEAELFVGRLMVKNAQEVKNYTDKLFRYELNPGNGDGEYLNRALVVTGSCNPEFTGPCSSFRDSLSHIYSRIDSLVDVNSITPSGTDVINTINLNNYGFLAIIGHGTPYGICVNEDPTENPRRFTKKRYLRNHYIPGRDSGETANGLDCLSNKCYPSVHYTYACSNMPFDFYSDDYHMGQEFTLGPNRGGVAYLGNTRSGIVISSPVLMMDFIKALSNGIHHVGMTEVWELANRHSGERMLIFTADNATAYELGRLFFWPVLTHHTKAAERKEFLERFRSGEYPVLVTSKVLNEGVDVPAAAVGVILSGSGSVREHVQRLGRILRPAPGKAQAVLYELISADTSEENVSRRRRNHDAYRRRRHA